MKRYLLLWWAVGFVVGCRGAPISEEEMMSLAGSEDGQLAAVEERAGYTACGRFSCLPGYEATLIHLEACEATQCTATQGEHVRSQEADKPPEPIK